MNSETDRPPPIARRPVLPVLLLFTLAVVFAALGVWQIKRLAWKERLIATVEARVHARPVALPEGGETALDALSANEYLRVRARGRYVAPGTALVRAVAVYGSGYWAMTPLRMADGRIVYINRGYVPDQSRLDEVRAATPSGPVVLIGLLRLTEPGGGFLRVNNPRDDRWYSRDVTALARSRGLRNVAPFFVDAQAEIPRSPGSPVAGLTVIRFPNDHLSYALTWFAMALLSLLGTGWLWRRGNVR